MRHRIRRHSPCSRERSRFSFPFPLLENSLEVTRTCLLPGLGVLQDLGAPLHLVGPCRGLTLGEQHQIVRSDVVLVGEASGRSAPSAQVGADTQPVALGWDAVPPPVHTPFVHVPGAHPSLPHLPRC